MCYPRPIRCVAIVHPYFPAQRDTDLLAEHAHLSRTDMRIDVSTFSPVLHEDNVEQETEERHIQWRNICHRNEASLEDFLEQHHFFRSNNYVHDEFRFWHGQENSWILFQDIRSWKERIAIQLTIYRRN